MTTYMRRAIYIDNAPLSCAGNTVDGFTLGGVQPTGTDRRIIFAVDKEDGSKKYVKLAVASGTATEAELKVNKATTSGATEETAATASDITADYVLSVGNTVTELGAVTSIPAWVGKNVYPIVALIAPEDSASAPTLKLGIKTTAGVDQYEKTEESPAYVLADEDVDVITVDANVETAGGAACDVSVHFFTNGAWGDYMKLTEAKNIRASKAQFKARYQVTAIGGEDSAKVKDAVIVYAASSAKVSGQTAEIITQTKHYALESDGKGLQFAQALIVHDKLRDAKIAAYAAFRAEPKTREMMQVATGDGKEQTVKLSDTGINHNSIKMQINGTPYWGFGYNTETNELTFTADKGAAVTASYEYGYEDEDWQKMEPVAQQVYENGTYASRYNYALPTTQTGKTIVDVKYELLRPTGDEKDVLLGTGTGDTQLFVLPHAARKDTITCTGKWTYNDDTRQLLVQAEKGAEIKISYHWVAESQKVHAVAAGWAELG